jgi:hypothetical protein
MYKVEVVLQTPETPEGYYDLIQQALFEINDLRASLEYDELDGPNMAQALGMLEAIEKPLQDMAIQMREGTYEFGTKELPFMPLARRQREEMLPFKHLLRMINETHVNGLGYKL